MTTGRLLRTSENQAAQGQAGKGTRRTKRWLAVGLGTFLIAVTAEATLIVEHPGPLAPETEGLTGGASALIWTGVYSGRVDRITVSFFFDPNTETSLQSSWASDLALVVIAPGLAPRQWGGADGSPFLYPGATQAGTWDSPDLDSNVATTYEGVLTSGMVGLEGSGTWQVAIVNAADIPGNDRRVYYSDLQIVLEGPQDPPALPDRAQPWECLLTTASALGVLGFMRRRASAA